MNQYVGSDSLRNVLKQCDILYQHCRFSTFNNSDVRSKVKWSQHIQGVYMYELLQVLKTSYLIIFYLERQIPNAPLEV